MLLKEFYRELLLAERSSSRERLFPAEKPLMLVASSHPCCLGGGQTISRDLMCHFPHPLPDLCFAWHGELPCPCHGKCGPCPASKAAWQCCRRACGGRCEIRTSPRCRHRITLSIHDRDKVQNTRAVLLKGPPGALHRASTRPRLQALKFSWKCQLLLL